MKWPDWMEIEVEPVAVLEPEGGGFAARWDGK